MNDKKIELSALDQFAMAALAGGIGQDEFHDCKSQYRKTPMEIADRAYDIAEAMMRRSKGEPKPEPLPMLVPTPPRAAMTIVEFCEAAGGISKSFFHKMIKDGTAPRIMKVGRRTLITAEAAAEWRREREGRNG